MVNVIITVRWPGEAGDRWGQPREQVFDFKERWERSKAEYIAQGWIDKSWEQIKAADIPEVDWPTFTVEYPDA